MKIKEPDHCTLGEEKTHISSNVQRTIMWKVVLCVGKENRTHNVSEKLDIQLLGTNLQIELLNENKSWFFLIYPLNPECSWMVSWGVLVTEGNSRTSKFYQMNYEVLSTKTFFNSVWQKKCLPHSGFYTLYSKSSALCYPFEISYMISPPHLYLAHLSNPNPLCFSSMKHSFIIQTNPELSSSVTLITSVTHNFHFLSLFSVSIIALISIEHILYFIYYLFLICLPRLEFKFYESRWIRFLGLPCIKSSQTGGFNRIYTLTVLDPEVQSQGISKGVSHWRSWEIMSSTPLLYLLLFPGNPWRAVGLGLQNSSVDLCIHMGFFSLVLCVFSWYVS